MIILDGGLIKISSGIYDIFTDLNVSYADLQAFIGDILQVRGSIPGKSM